jgi:hypothetical protein
MVEIPGESAVARFSEPRPPVQKRAFLDRRDATSPLEVFGDGVARAFATDQRLSIIDRDQPIRIRPRIRLQQDRVDDRKHRTVRANAERERKHRDRGKAG